MMNLNDMTAKQMVAEYNELTGESVKRFSDRKSAVRRLEKARADAAAKAKKSTRKAKDENGAISLPRDGSKLRDLIDAMYEGEVDVRLYATKVGKTESFIRAQIGYLRDKGWPIYNVEFGSRCFTIDTAKAQELLKGNAED